MPLEERRRQLIEQSRETTTAHRSGESVETKLLRIAEKARKEPEFQFTSLYHLMNVELLRGCFAGLKPGKAPGIDQVTKEEYAEDLEGNLARLVEKLHRMAYIPQPVRRAYIPKPGSTKQRPLGIPCLEDKLVQAGLARILGAIYEEDFIEDSYGSRPKRNCHDALRTLSREVEEGPINHIVEADIKGFFDHVKQDWLMKFLEHRVKDTRILRMIKRFLRAGISEDGSIRASEEGTPQGGTISPTLANIYLHYALDLWFARVYQKRCSGRARLIRYVDDFVVCFQYLAEAERFREELAERLGRFGLEVEPSKTKVLAFGRWAEANAKAKGKEPETFDFLGFTHYCSRTRDGKRFRMKRVTARKKFRAKVAAFKEWIKRARTKRISEIWETAGRKLQGHYNYYGVTDNFAGIRRYYEAVKRLLVKWLRRRSQRRRLNWEKFNRMLDRHPLPKPRIVRDLIGRWA
jgi:group II intron reverse transcriptase/maturase